MAKLNRRDRKSLNEMFERSRQQNIKNNTTVPVFVPATHETHITFFPPKRAHVDMIIGFVRDDTNNVVWERRQQQTLVEIYSGVSLAMLDVDPALVAATEMLLTAGGYIHGQLECRVNVGDVDAPSGTPVVEQVRVYGIVTHMIPGGGLHFAQDQIRIDGGSSGAWDYQDPWVPRSNIMHRAAMEDAKAEAKIRRFIEERTDPDLAPDDLS